MVAQQGSGFFERVEWRLQAPEATAAASSAAARARAQRWNPRLI